MLLVISIISPKESEISKPEPSITHPWVYYCEGRSLRCVVDFMIVTVPAMANICSASNENVMGNLTCTGAN